MDAKRRFLHTKMGSSKFDGEGKSPEDNRDVISLTPGTVLMREGEKGDCAYLLMLGRLSASKEVKGERVVLGEIMPMEIVGELAILSDSPRAATVRVEEYSEVVKINPHRLKTLIRRSPEIAEIVIKILCRRLQENSQKLVETIDRFRASTGAVDLAAAERFPMEIMPEEAPRKPSLEAEKIKRQRMATIERRDKS